MHRSHLRRTEYARQRSFVAPAEEIVMIHRIQPRHSEQKAGMMPLPPSKIPSALRMDEHDVCSEQHEDDPCGDKRAEHPLTPDQVALVERHLNLAGFALQRNRRLWVGFLDEEEAFQEATVGLMKAAQRFDPTKGFQFSTYALWWVKSFLKDAVRTSRVIRVPEPLWQKMHHLRQVQGQLEQEGKELSPKHLADILGWEKDQTEKMLEVQWSINQHILSLEQPLYAGDEDMLGATIIDPEENVAEQVELHLFVNQLLTCLTPLERQIVLLRYQLQEVGDQGRENTSGRYPLPYTLVAERLGKTREVIQVREQHAFLKLRYALHRLEKERPY